MTHFVIETKDLTKKYGDFVAVDHLNLSVAEGEVFGLLGPNGAGKTTTILMVLGLTEPSEGSVQVLGLNPARQPLSVKSHVGYMPDQVGFYDELTARENLTYIAKLNGIAREEASQRIKEALARVGLGKLGNRRVGTFSRGMRQRLGVADVLIKQPGIIIMDEPTQGLDPESAHEFLDMVRELKREGITILLASHLLYQVQAVCDRVGLFHRGRMVLQGTVPELAQQVLAGAYRIHLEAVGPEKSLTSALEGLSDSVSVRYLNSNQYEVEAKSDLRAEAASAVLAAGGKLLSLDMETQSLDFVYSKYFQEVGHDAEH